MALSRNTKIIVAFIVVVAIGYGFVLYWKSQTSVPQAFIDARSAGALIAMNIVDTSRQSGTILQDVNQEDLNGNDKAALNLVSNLITQSESLRNQAVELSSKVQAMTQSLSGINSFDARQAALEAISSHLALINELITYSGDLGKLSDALQTRFSGGKVPNGEIQALVNEVNADVTAINSFNTQATQDMQQFDKLTGR